MSFTGNLAANPSSGIFGQPTQRSDQDVLGIVNQLKDREMNDFQKKASFMADLSLKQDRLRRLYDPTSTRTATQGQLHNQEPDTFMQQKQPQNIQMGRDPNAMNEYQRGELGVRRQGMDLEKQKLAQQSKMGEEAMSIKDRQQKLNQEKSDQINENKQNDMQRKSDEAATKIDMLQKQLDAKTKAGENTLQAHRDLAASVEERHNLERDMTQHKMDIQEERFNTLKKQHEELMKQNAKTKQTRTDSSGNSITTTTEKGSAIGAPVKNSDGTYTVTGPDGRTGKIPANKLDDWNKNHQPNQPDDQQDEE